MLDQAVECERQLTDLVAALCIHLHGEIIVTAHAPHCRRQRMQRTPKMAAQSSGKVCRHTKCDGIHHEDKAKEIVQRGSIQMLAQMNREARIRRRIRTVTKDRLRCSASLFEGKFCPVMIEHIHHHSAAAVR